MKIKYKLDTNHRYFSEIEVGTTFKRNADDMDDVFIKTDTIIAANGNYFNATHLSSGKVVSFKNYDCVYRVKSTVIVGE